MNTRKYQKKKLGLCLSGGGSRGYAMLPILKEFTQKGLQFDHVAGTSIGAIIGAYYCLNGEVDTLYEFIKKMRKRDWTKLVKLNNLKISIIKSKRIQGFLVDNFFADKTFRDLKIPLTIAATNISSNKTEYFKEGPLIDAIMASISIPGLFPPYQIGQYYYVDGGVKDNFPANALLESGVDKIIGINLTKISTNGKEEKSHENLIEVLSKCFYMMIENYDLTDLQHKNFFVFEPQFTSETEGILSFHKFQQTTAVGTKEYTKHKEDFVKFVDM